MLSPIKINDVGHTFLASIAYRWQSHQDVLIEVTMDKQDIQNFIMSKKTDTPLRWLITLQALISANMLTEVEYKDDNSPIGVLLNDISVDYMALSLRMQYRASSKRSLSDLCLMIDKCIGMIHQKVTDLAYYDRYSKAREALESETAVAAALRECTVDNPE